MFKNYFNLLRVSHYSKNLFVFLPIFFGGNLFNFDLVYNNLIAFVSFCLFSSAVYIINDIVDLDYDIKHPIKKNRPITSKKISLSTAVIFIIILLCFGTIFSFFNNIYLFWILIIYFILNLLYSFKLKNFPIIDLMIISFGFLLRIFAGSVTSGIQISHWLIIMVFLLSMFLSTAKRRDDIKEFINKGEKHRGSIDKYSISFIDSLLSFFSSIVVITYILYTLDENVISKFGENLYLTSIFVILGFLRYKFQIFVLQKSGSPTNLFLNDRILQLVIILWCISFGWSIYFR